MPIYPKRESVWTPEDIRTSLLDEPIAELAARLGRSPGAVLLMRSRFNRVPTVRKRAAVGAPPEWVMPSHVPCGPALLHP
jgi:hypothetical protein